MEPRPFERAIFLRFDASESLRSRSDEYWSRIVSKLGMSVLSKIDNGLVAAYLLSESSLILGEDSLLLVSCNLTPFEIGLAEVCSNFSAVVVHYELLLHPRSSDYWKDETKSLISADEKFLLNVDRCVCKFNTTGYLSHSQKAKESTLPISEVIWNVPEDFSTIELQQNKRAEFAEWKKDDWIFTPPGYSFHALRDAVSVSVHYTEDTSGCSFVTSRTALHHSSPNR